MTSYGVWCMVYGVSSYKRVRAPSPMNSPPQLMNSPPQLLNSPPPHPSTRCQPLLLLALASDIRAGGLSPLAWTVRVDGAGVGLTLQALQQYEQAAHTAVLIARQEQVYALSPHGIGFGIRYMPSPLTPLALARRQELGNYKVAHAQLFDTFKELEAQVRSHTVTVAVTVTVTVTVMRSSSTPSRSSRLPTHPPRGEFVTPERRVPTPVANPYRLAEGSM
eukprot:6680804-Pyramimonas_sp.AAC.1